MVVSLDELIVGLIVGIYCYNNNYYVNKSAALAHVYYIETFPCWQVYKQKVKHLLYEHQNNVTELKRDGELRFDRLIAMMRITD